MHDLGEIRSLLQRAPSRATWNTLCAILDDAALQTQTEVLIPYCEGALRRWPHRLRLAPRRWCDVALDGQAPPALALTRRAVLDATGAQPDALRAALDSPALSRLLDLEVSFGELDVPSARALTRSELTGRLERLAVCATRRIQPRALSALINAPNLGLDLAPLSLELRDTPNLDILLEAPGALTLHALRLVADPGEATFDAMCESPHLTNLRALDLSYVQLDPGRARKLATARHLLGVRRLELSLTDPAGSSTWPAGTLEPLLFSPLFDSLEHLDIKGLDDDSATAIADSGALEDLRSLSVTLLNQRSTRALAALLRAESRVPLESLRASGGALDGSLHHACSPSLTTLDLSNTSLSPDDLSALATLPSLERLAVFTPRDVTSLGALVDALPARVERLTIDGVLATGPADLDGLSRWRGGHAVHSLTLRHTLSALTPDARAEACAALDLSAWTSLRALDLGANQLDAAPLPGLLQRPPSLEHLSLRHNQLVDPSLLTDALPTHLRSLHLSSNPLDPDALARLLSSDTLRHLHVLSLSNARLDDELLARALSSANLPRLHTLSSRRCGFGPLSARALAESGLLSTLRRLDVAMFRNYRPAAAIADYPASSHLTRLILPIAGPVDPATLRDLRASTHLRPRIIAAMSSAYEVGSDTYSS